MDSRRVLHKPLAFVCSPNFPTAAQVPMLQVNTSASLPFQNSTEFVNQFSSANHHQPTCSHQQPSGAGKGDTKSSPNETPSMSAKDEEGVPSQALKYWLRRKMVEDFVQYTLKQGCKL